MKNILDNVTYAIENIIKDSTHTTRLRLDAGRDADAAAERRGRPPSRSRRCDRILRPRVPLPRFALTYTTTNNHYNINKNSRITLSSKINSLVCEEG